LLESALFFFLSFSLFFSSFIYNSLRSFDFSHSHTHTHTHTHIFFHSKHLRMVHVYMWTLFTFHTCFSWQGACRVSLLFSLTLLTMLIFRFFYRTNSQRQLSHRPHKNRDNKQHSHHNKMGGLMSNIKFKTPHSPLL
jgi:ABC-type protease/lipase transport system fused ATPase/permease subunit